MATIKLVCLLCLVLLLGADVGAARLHADSRRRSRELKLFVFGDGYADNGNSPRTELSEPSRGWYTPYGESNNGPTGRYSDGLVQSDLVAKMLGYSEAPRPNKRRVGNEVDPAGATFAVFNSTVLDDDSAVATLHSQIDVFQRLTSHHIVDDDYLKDSVALVAMSGNADFRRVPFDTSLPDVRDFTGNMMDTMVDGVTRLLNLGVPKVVVNSLPPYGCAPFRSLRSSNYTSCESSTNNMAIIGNEYLRQKLADAGVDDKVLVLDIYNTFSNIVTNPGTTQFYHKHIPCCEAFDVHNGYCGLVDTDGNPQYSVCDDPENYFYFDTSYPTQAGWKAAMEVHEQHIRNFLDISSY